MADVRALLAAERESRRISHPHLTYSKNGSLTCNVCNLNVKSEQLWPGHLKSLNHRKNVQKTSESVARPAKRKIESVDDGEEQERDYEVDSRKKPKSASQNLQETGTTESALQPIIAVSEPPPVPTEEEIVEQVPVQKQEQSDTVDEDEWAAFERDVAPLAQPNYASVTIEAAPVSAVELAEQLRSNEGQRREDEAEAEREDESRRMEEEFDVMEEMEDRIRRLRERHEALRTKDPPTTIQEETSQDIIIDKDEKQPSPVEDRDEESSEDEVDDWYG
ncbi:hypothetical protein H2198_004577 [Neophaeococcomyces mojaviensis]|uniref:Uncharacterized protein n=1 Tax=Neophaeococcomyces mojaviensis TaxID=3383035 RepID=A0ACC3A892_9EURO|nr:hypothetical protein H2198_004577 [Knufia sp. JES_112]